MIKFKTDKLGEWIIKVCIIFLLSFFLLMSLISYQWQKMDKFVEEVDLSRVEGIIEKMSCEIKYKDFYYNGFCVDNDEVWRFLRDIYIKEKVYEINVTYSNNHTKGIKEIK